MVCIHRAFLDTARGQVHYRYAGDPLAPAVAMFHESPLSGATYELALPILGQWRFAIAPDTPGYGDSEGPSAPLEIPSYASWLLGFLRELGLKRCSLVGAHTGASLAMEIARQAPEMVDRLVLMGVTLYTREERQQMIDSWTPPFVPKDDGSHLQWVWERYQRIWGKDSPAWLLHSATVQFLKVGEKYNWAYQAAFRYDPEPVLRQLRQPVLYLIAENDLLADKNDFAVSITPHCTARVIPGLAGQLPLRAPTVFAEAVNEFLGT